MFIHYDDIHCQLPCLLYYQNHIMHWKCSNIHNLITHPVTSWAILTGVTLTLPPQSYFLGHEVYNTISWLHNILGTS